MCNVRHRRGVWRITAFHQYNRYSFRFDKLLSSGMEPLYIRIADTLTDQIARGTLRAGDRVPSLRQLSAQQRVSMSTALQAYLWLESRGFLEARPQSGFYVRTPFANLIPEPQFEQAKTLPPAVGSQEVMSDVIESAGDPSNV